MQIPLLATNQAIKGKVASSPGAPVTGEGRVHASYSNAFTGTRLAQAGWNFTAAGPDGQDRHVQTTGLVLAVDTTLQVDMGVTVSIEVQGQAGAAPSSLQMYGSYSTQLNFDEATFHDYLRSIGASTVFDAADYFHIEYSSPMPEPSTYATLLAGLAGLGAWARRRRPKAGLSLH